MSSRIERFLVPYDDLVITLPLEQKYSADQPRDEHGRWTASGSSTGIAKFDEALKNAGFKVSQLDQHAGMKRILDEEFRDLTEVAMEQNHEPIVNGIIAGVQSLEETYGKEVVNSVLDRYPLIFGYGNDPNTTMTTVNGPEGQRAILINLDSQNDFKSGVGKDELSYTAYKAEQIFRETNQKDVAMEEHMRLVFIHEVAHTLDADDRQLSKALVKDMNDLHFPKWQWMDQWLRNNISGYAAANAVEAAAEAFTIMTDKPAALPSQLKNFSSVAKDLSRKPLTKAHVWSS